MDTLTDYIYEYYRNDNLSNLKKMTLIIPTYNRNYYLSRSLYYHCHFPFTQIIVADSSSKDKITTNRTIINNMSKKFGIEILHLTYHQEPEIWGKDYFRKWGDAASHATTEYCHYCADKDFLIPRTLIKDIEFLDTHSDYGVSSGCYKVISHYNPQSKVGSLWDAYSDHESRNENDPVQRLKLSFTPYYRMLIYASFRTETLNEVLNYNLKYNISDVRFGECLHTAISSLCAKFNYLPEHLECVRDISMRNKTNAKCESSATCLRDIPEYNMYPESQNFYTYFKNAVANAIVDKTGLGLSDAEKIVDEDIYSRIIAGYSRHWKYLPLNIRINIFMQQNIMNSLERMPYGINNYTDKLLYAISRPKWQKIIEGFIRVNKSKQPKTPEEVLIRIISDSIDLYNNDKPILTDVKYNNEFE